MVIFSLLLMGAVAHASFPSEEKNKKLTEPITSEGNVESYCSQESCQELRERVEQLEEAVRAIVSSFSGEKNYHRELEQGTADETLRSNKIRENPALRPFLVRTSTAQREGPSDINNKSLTITVDENSPLAPSSSIYRLKKSVKCSLAHILDIHFSGSNEYTTYICSDLLLTLVLFIFFSCRKQSSIKFCSWNLKRESCSSVRIGEIYRYWLVPSFC